MLHLEVMAGTTVVSRHTMSSRAFAVGRGPGNDLVLGDETVSAKHFRVWMQSGRLLAADVGSRNGTWRGGERISSTVVLAAGDWLRVGESTWVRIVESEVDASLPVVEDVATGQRHAFQRDRLSFGAMPGMVGAKSLPWLVVEPDGEIWLEGDESAQLLSVDQPFVVAERHFCLRTAQRSQQITRDAVLAHELPRTRYPYLLAGRLDGTIGPEVTLSCAESRKTICLTSDNRALLVYILGRKFAADLERGDEHLEAGWCHDEEVAVGIWGRALATQQLGNLNVLVWRVRRELQQGGFEPACLEKRRRHLRLRIERADIR